MKKILSLLLTLTMVLSLSVPIFADGTEVTGGTGTVPVTLNAEATTFSVTVPTSLPISINADGEVTVATSEVTKITNNSVGPIKVTDVTTNGVNGWVVEELTNSTDYSAEKVNTKKVAIKVDDALGKIDGNSFKTFTYNAKAPTQSSAINNTTVANVVFSVGWDSE